jgi:hypothetical protein
MFAMLAGIAVSCSNLQSGPTVNPVLPQSGITAALTEADVQQNHYLWGYYVISYDPESNTANVMPVRDASTHWNVLKFMEVAPCANCVKVTGITPGTNGSKIMDVQISHPFTNPNLTGFDVRGIDMFNGSDIFPLTSLTLPNSSAGDGELVNADGFTTLYNSSTLGAGPGGLQGYFDGKYASPTAPSAKLNGFKRHISTGVTRNMLLAGDKVTVPYEIVFPTGFFVFGYAIDASWMPPINKPVVNPAADFPTSANCPEPWRIDVTQIPFAGGFSQYGGLVVIDVDVYDYQGKDSYNEPVMECPQFFTGLKTMFFKEDFPDHTRWEIGIVNDKPVGIGDYNCVIRVVDKSNLTAPSWLDLSAYNVTKFEVAERGWAISVGGTLNEFATQVATDSTGNIYVTGTFSDTVDFDPGPSIVNRTSNGGEDVFLAAYTSKPEFLWVVSWGSQYQDLAGDIALNGTQIFVTGGYQDSVDFDPGSGLDPRTAIGGFDIYLSTYDTSGNYVRTLTWGGIGSFEQGQSVAVSDQGLVYVLSDLQGQADMDPGAGIDLQGTPASTTTVCFLSQFDLLGNYTWGRLWGDPLISSGPNSVDTDATSNAYACGYYSGTVDFDPSSGGADVRTSAAADAFVVKFDQAGNYVWAGTWGGTNTDYASGIKLDPSGYPLVAGQFIGTVDLDPTGGVDNHTTAGYGLSLTKLNSDGGFFWAKSFGNTSYSNITSVDTDQSGNSEIMGYFSITMDFDPGSVENNVTSAGGADIFVSRFDPDGNLVWVSTFGGTDYDYSTGLAIDQATGLTYNVGYFYTTTDLQPGPYVSNFTSAGNSDIFITRLMQNGLW